ncbi:MAG: protein translocase subunit SecF [Coriobacteriales bacterium]
MKSLRPHRQFNFVGLWKYGFILSGILIALAAIGLVASLVTTGSALTLGTEFSGGTSIQITNTGDITQDQVKDAFASAADTLGIESQISSIQTSTDASGNPGFIVKTTNTVSTDANQIMMNVESQLGINGTNVQIETIGASWGASVIGSSILAFLLSCVGILIVIAIRYREPRMGVVALITLFHDMFIIIGVYAWAGMFFHMEVTSDVIAALLAIIGYSLYDTIVVFHRINKNASPQMKCSMKTCANRSVNEIIVRSLNTSITSILPVLLMLILGTDTLRDFAFAMFCGMLIGVYSTIAISAPIYTLWKCRQPEYARLEKKYPYEVVQSTFTKEMLLQARVDAKQARKDEKSQLKASNAANKKQQPATGDNPDAAAAGKSADE